VKHVVAKVGEIPPGGRKIVTLEGRSIGVFNLAQGEPGVEGLDGEYFALRNRCPHQGGALCAGKLVGAIRAELPGKFEYDPRREVLICPWHGWEFLVRTGRSWCAPDWLRVRSYPVSVETYAVSVEEPFIVVEISG
jgi:3-phenylpropionate/trans-cinnamate dioxygenase ferredoxin subunit